MKKDVDDIPVELKRLETFALLAYKGIPGLVSAIEKIRGKRPNISSYFGKKANPGRKLLTDVEKVGGNRFWIQTGQGSMFADNEQGRLLAKNLNFPPQASFRNNSTTDSNQRGERKLDDNVTLRSLIILENNLSKSLEEVRVLMRRMGYKGEDSVTEVDIDFDDLVSIKFLPPQPQPEEEEVHSSKK